MLFTGAQTALMRLRYITFIQSTLYYACYMTPADEKAEKLVEKVDARFISVAIRMRITRIYVRKVKGML